MTFTSVDTNLLAYSVISDVPEHPAALEFVRRLGDDTVISELALVELYAVVRNAKIMVRPFDAASAVAIVERFRRHPTWQLVDHEPDVMSAVWAAARQPGFARTRIFDARLALGLVRRGVTRFATRNVKHFHGFGFDEVWGPLAS